MPELCRISRPSYFVRPTAATRQPPISTPISLRISTERQEAEIVDPSAAVFLATADDLIIGYVHIVVDPVDERSALLNRIYIAAEWRGSGLADYLLEAVLNESAQRGVTRLELTVFERNVRAIAFYKRSGFAATGTTTFTVGEDFQTDVVMEMDLVERFNNRTI